MPCISQNSLSSIKSTYQHFPKQYHKTNRTALYYRMSHLRNTMGSEFVKGLNLQNKNQEVTISSQDWTTNTKPGGHQFIIGPNHKQNTRCQHFFAPPSHLHKSRNHHAITKHIRTKSGEHHMTDLPAHNTGVCRPTVFFRVIHHMKFWGHRYSPRPVLYRRISNNQWNDINKTVYKFRSIYCLIISIDQLMKQLVWLYDLKCLQSTNTYGWFSSLWNIYYLS